MADLTTQGLIDRLFEDSKRFDNLALVIMLDEGGRYHARFIWRKNATPESCLMELNEIVRLGGQPVGYFGLADLGWESADAKSRSGSIYKTPIACDKESHDWMMAFLDELEACYSDQAIARGIWLDVTPIGHG